MNWKQLFAGREKHTPLQFPCQEELIPGGSKATIYSHSIPTPGGDRPCWSFVSEGLARYKQREVIFTLLREEGEAAECYPHQLLDVFRLLHDLSKQGRTAGPGGFTSGGEGSSGFHGFTYVEPVWMPPGNSPPGKWLAMIGLTADEAGVLRGFGSTRLLSMMGKREGVYPAPYWTERNRANRLLLKSMEESFLYSVPLVSESGFCVYREGNRIALRAYAEAAGETVKDLRSRPADSPVALLTRIHSGADGALVWVPGQNQPEVNAPDGSRGQRLCGSFVYFLPDQLSDGEQLMEDGYLLRLSSQSWRRLRNAILTQEDIETSVFELHWIPAGLEDYLPMASPGVAAPPPAGSVFSRKIVLLQSNAETGAAITVDALNFFEQTVEDAVRSQFSHEQAGGGLRVTVAIEPSGKVNYQLATQGVVEDVALQHLWGDLQKLVPPTVKKPVAFAVEFEV